MTSISLFCILKLPFGIKVLPSLSTITASAFSGILISFIYLPHHLWLLSIIISLSIIFSVSSKAFAASTIVSSGNMNVSPFGTIHVLFRMTTAMSHLRAKNNITDLLICPWMFYAYVHLNKPDVTFILIITESFSYTG